MQQDSDILAVPCVRNVRRCCGFKPRHRGCVGGAERPGLLMIRWKKKPPPPGTHEQHKIGNAHSLVGRSRSQLFETEKGGVITIS